MQSLGGAQKPPALVVSPELGNCPPPHGLGREGWAPSGASRWEPEAFVWGESWHMHRIRKTIPEAQAEKLNSDVKPLPPPLLHGT